MIRVVSLCSGYDSQCLALEALKESHPDFEYELVAWSEIDKNAIKAHNLLFPQWADRNVGDMTKADWSKVGGCDLLTYSTPCTDISNAGLQKGIAEGSNTRSSILWSTRNAIKELKPKYLMMENVSSFVSDKFRGELRRGRVQGGGMICPTLTSASSESIIRIQDMKEKTKKPKGKGWLWDKEEKKWFRIRRLIPRECLRLMGVKDKHIDKLVGISDSQLYKMAGNSIVVDVMCYMFENLFYPKEEYKDTLF